MGSAIKDICRIKDWTLIVWRWSARRCWTYKRWRGWAPNVKRYWSGKIVHYCFGPFELVHDKRGDSLDIMADIAGCSRDDMAERFVASLKEESRG